MAPALFGPTLKEPTGSIQAILPPPALTSARSITGTLIGCPVPCSQRLPLPSPPTSYSGVVSITPFFIKLAFAVVPPMSKDRRLARLIWLPPSAAAITPAAGPDSAAIAGIIKLSSISNNPPPEPMTYGVGKPFSVTEFFKRAK